MPCAPLHGEGDEGRMMRDEGNEDDEDGGDCNAVHGDSDGDSVHG